MYTLLNGQKVKQLSFHSTGKESWEQSQWFWNNGKKCALLYNTETGEISAIDANGDEILNW